MNRITPGKGYLEALASPNVDVAFGSLANVTETGFEMENGTSYQVDALVCATGFVWRLEALEIRDSNTSIGYIIQTSIPTYWFSGDRFTGCVERRTGSVFVDCSAFFPQLFR